MASFDVETIDFESGDVTSVVTVMASLASRGDGRGWLNIGPGLRDDQIAGLPSPTSWLETLVRGFVAARGPVVPMATWTAPRKGAGPTEVVVGIQHGAGPKALERLRDAGMALPSGWRKVQDHAKSGIVAETPPDASHEEVLSWLLDACRSLCPLEIDDHWLAEVHRPL